MPPSHRKVDDRTLNPTVLAVTHKHWQMLRGEMGSRATSPSLLRNPAALLEMVEALHIIPPVATLSELALSLALAPIEQDTLPQMRHRSRLELTVCRQTTPAVDIRERQAVTGRERT
jgi:hypothetical protein